MTPIQYYNNPTFELYDNVSFINDLEVGQKVNVICTYEVIEVNEDGVRIRITNINPRINGRKF